IVGPTLTIALPVFLLSIFRRRPSASFSVLFLTVAALNQLTSGGRFLLVYAAVMAAALISRAGALRIRTLKVRLLVVALVLAVLAITLARGNTVVFEAYTYLAVPIPLLANGIDYIDSADVQTYGASFAYGVLTLVFRLAEAVGGSFGADISAAVSMPQ